MTAPLTPLRWLGVWAPRSVDLGPRPGSKPASTVTLAAQIIKVPSPSQEATEEASGLDPMDFKPRTRPPGQLAFATKYLKSNLKASSCLVQGHRLHYGSNPQGLASGKPSLPRRQDPWTCSRHTECIPVYDLDFLLKNGKEIGELAYRVAIRKFAIKGKKLFNHSLPIGHKGMFIVINDADSDFEVIG
ncbi:hypothetical protein RB213_009393 [Colletotrichum asianum]